MTSLWHILWPGWRELLAQIFGGLWTLPVLVPAQLFIMHLWSKRKFRVLHERVEALESAPSSVGICGETTPDRLSSLGNVDGTQWSPDRPSARSDAFKGW